MSSRKLQVLGYHSADSFDVNDDKQLKTLVVWLENQKIRFYKIEERTSLSEASSDEWLGVFVKYLNDLGCPFVEPLKTGSACDWLVSLAVRYEFEDTAESHTNLQCKLGTIPPDCSRLSVDPADPDLRKGTEILSSLLHVVPHPDVGVALEAIRLLIEEHLVAAVASGNETSPPSSSQQQESVRCRPQQQQQQQRLDLASVGGSGRGLSSAAVQRAAGALRLLHLGELRSLQTSINRRIMAAQALTANPRTDHSLGKVGK